MVGHLTLEEWQLVVDKNNEWWQTYCDNQKIIQGVAIGCLDEYGERVMVADIFVEELI